MPDSLLKMVTSTSLPDTASAEEQQEFQRGLQLIAQLITQQQHAPNSPMMVQAISESES